MMIVIMNISIGDKRENLGKSALRMPCVPSHIIGIPKVAFCVRITMSVHGADLDNIKKVVVQPQKC